MWPLFIKAVRAADHDVARRWCLLGQGAGANPGGTSPVPPPARLPPDQALLGLPSLFSERRTPQVGAIWLRLAAAHALPLW